MHFDSCWKNSLLLSLLFLCVSCGDNLPRSSHLDNLRILALKADKPQTTLGVEVALTALISDVKGNGRSLSYTFSACLDRGVGQGAPIECDWDPTRYEESGDFKLNAPTFTGAAPIVRAKIPFFALLGKGSQDQFNGTPYLFIYKVTAADGETRTAFKRILVVKPSQQTWNKNPDIQSILSNGLPLSGLPGDPALLESE